MAKTATATKPTTEAKPPVNQGQLAVIEEPRLPYLPELEKQYEITKSAWRTLVEAIYPAAQSVSSVVLALDYCRARNLDPMKRVVHIVPIYDRVRKKMVDTIWPGIAEVRTTAFRTKTYAGCDEAVFGPPETKSWTVTYEDESRQQQTREITVTFPKWCQITVYRDLNGQRCKFVGPKVLWEETYATFGRTDVPNDMWQNRPEGQLEKCAEAAALRKAFPEELGNELIGDEVGHARGSDIAQTGGTIIDHEPQPRAAEPAPQAQAEQSQESQAQEQPQQELLPPEKPAMSEKTKAWLADIKKRLDGCTDVTGVLDVRKVNIEPFNDKMNPELKAEVKKLLDAALARVAPAPDNTDTTGTVDEPPFDL